MTTKKIKDNYSDDVRLALLEQSINNINDTMVRFEKKFDQIDFRLNKIDERFDKIEDKFDEKFDRIDNKFDKMIDKFDKLNDKIDSNLKWTFRVITPLLIGLLGVMARGFHWI